LNGIIVKLVKSEEKGTGFRAYSKKFRSKGDMYIVPFQGRRETNRGVLSFSGEKSNKQSNSKAFQEQRGTNRGIPKLFRSE